MKYKNNKFLLLIIILLGFALRFYRLGDFPPSLNWDEVSHGYNAFSIIKTGADEWGVRFPLIFRAFGDFKLPAYIYLTTFPVFAFGLTAFAVRFVSALAGTLAIIFIYLLTRQLFEDKKFDYGLLAAFILAICPWHFFFSRAALEANLSLTFLIAGAWLLIRATRSGRDYVPAALFLGLSLHTYNTARVFVPLLLILFAWIYRRKIKFGPSLLISLIIVTFSFALVIYQLRTGEATARYSKLAILNSVTTFQIGQTRQASHLPPLVSRLIYNRPVFFLTKFTSNYLSYFTPTFINQSKGVQTQFAIPNQPLFTHPVLILTLFGLLLQLSLVRKESSAKFILGWLLIAPIAAAVTIDPPQAIRPNPLMVPVVLLAVSAVIWLTKRFGVIVLYLTIILTGFSFALYANQYFNIYPTHFSQSWQYGYDQAIQYALDHKNEYDRVFITKKYGEPHIFYAFFSKLDPKVLQSNFSSTRFKQSDWFWTDRIENVYFVNDWQIPRSDVFSLKLESGGVINTKKSLLITSPDHIPLNVARIKSINFLDGSQAFVIARF